MALSTSDTHILCAPPYPRDQAPRRADGGILGGNWKLDIIQIGTEEVVDHAAERMHAQYKSMVMFKAHIKEVKESDGDSEKMKEIVEAKYTKPLKGCKQWSEPGTPSRTILNEKMYNIVSGLDYI